MLFGNFFVFQQFQGKTHIDLATRQLVFGVLIAVSFLGFMFLLALDTIKTIQNDFENGIDEKNGFVDEFKNTLKLFFTKEMIFLSITFFYTGLEFSFLSGVYSSSVGFTTAIGENAKQLVGMSGICIGAGEIIGGLHFGFFATRATLYGRVINVILGFIFHLFAFFLIYVNLPDLSPLGDTNTTSLLNPPLESIALHSAFLLGLGDACFNTQIYSMIGVAFANKTASALAIFKFTQSIAAAICYIYSTYFGMRVQLLILYGFGLIGTAAFSFADWSVNKRLALEAESID